MILHKLRCECAGLSVTLYKLIIIGLKGNFNLDRSGLTIVAPITTTSRNFPTYHELTSTRTIQGKVMLDQTMTLDLAARGVAKVEERLSQEELKLILDKYKLLFDMED